MNETHTIDISDVATNELFLIYWISHHHSCIYRDCPLCFLFLLVFDVVAILLLLLCNVVSKQLYTSTVWWRYGITTRQWQTKKKKENCEYLQR